MSPFDLPAEVTTTRAQPKEPALTPLECTFDIVFGLMLPIYLAAAKGDLALARAALCDLIASYDAVNAAEIELVSRIHTLSHVAMDSMNRSLQPDLSDTRILRYRSSAMAMLRTAEQCRKALEAMQTRRRETAAQDATSRQNAQIDAFAATASQRFATQPPAKAPQPTPPAVASKPLSTPAEILTHHLDRALAETPDLNMTEAEIEALRQETMAILDRGKALFGDPFAPLPAAAEAAALP